MSAVKEVMDRLRESIEKLNAAQQKGFQGLAALEKLENLIAQALGNTDGGRRLRGQVQLRARRIKAEVVQIQSLVKDVNAAIDQLNKAGAGGAGRVPSGGNGPSTAGATAPA
jgi:prefoldin subunit 5